MDNEAVSTDHLEDRVTLTRDVEGKGEKKTAWTAETLKSNLINCISFVFITGLGQDCSCPWLNNLYCLTCVLVILTMGKIVAGDCGNKFDLKRSKFVKSSGNVQAFSLKRVWQFSLHNRIPWRSFEHILFEQELLYTTSLLVLVNRYILVEELVVVSEEVSMHSSCHLEIMKKEYLNPSPNSAM